MGNRKRSTIIAAALILMGAAGLLFASYDLISARSNAKSNQQLLFSVGAVPAPIGATPTTEPTISPTDPTIAKTLGPASDPLADEALTATPVPRTGSSASGNRTARERGFDPTTLIIPKIDLHTAVISVGTTASGEMEAPGSYWEAGWWSPGAQPGDVGKAVIAGHIDSPSGPAIFVKLDQLSPGDEIFVRNDTRELRYIVRGAAVYRVDAAPLEAIFGPSTEQELILITCGGTFDRASASYLHRRVVFAVLAGTD